MAEFPHARRIVDCVRIGARQTTVRSRSGAITTRYCRNVATKAAESNLSQAASGLSSPHVLAGSQTATRRDSIKEAKPFSDFLTDAFSRQHDYLRISVTERCNLRCLYCMPEEGIQLSPPSHLLTTPEITYLSSLFVSQGVTKIRLTGGEPTIRHDIIPLMRSLGALRSAGLRDIGLTTNGLTLRRKLDAMVEAGLTAVNLSLDTLDPFQFQIMTRRNGFDKVMQAMDRILEMKKSGANIKLKINCVVMRGLNDREIVPFVELGREKDVEIRFIEYMPFGGNKWSKGKMVPYVEILDTIRQKYPTMHRTTASKSETAKVWQIPGFAGKVGFITSMTNDFCSSCNRLRITSDGNLKVCLHGNAEVSLRDVLREGNDGKPMDDDAFNMLSKVQQDLLRGDNAAIQTHHVDQKLLEIIGAAVKRKKEKHAGIGQLEHMTNRPMILIDPNDALVHTLPPSPKWLSHAPFGAPVWPLHVRSSLAIQQIRSYSTYQESNRWIKHTQAGRIQQSRTADSQVPNDVVVDAANISSTEMSREPRTPDEGRVSTVESTIEALPEAGDDYFPIPVMTPYAMSSSNPTGHTSSRMENSWASPEKHFRRNPSTKSSLWSSMSPSKAELGWLGGLKVAEFAKQEGHTFAGAGSTEFEPSKFDLRTRTSAQSRSSPGIEMVDSQTLEFDLQSRMTAPSPHEATEVYHPVAESERLDHGRALVARFEHSALVDDIQRSLHFADANLTKILQDLKAELNQIALRLPCHPQRIYPEWGQLRRLMENLTTEMKDLFHWNADSKADIEERKAQEFLMPTDYPLRQSGTLPFIRKFPTVKSYGQSGVRDIEEEKNLQNERPLPFIRRQLSNTYDNSGEVMLKPREHSNTWAPTAQQVRHYSTSSRMAPPDPGSDAQLPHLTPSGAAHMVSVSGKQSTLRRAIAVGFVAFSSANTIDLVEKGQLKKGDVLGTARVAGIMAAKSTATMIPLCHPLPLTGVGVEMRLCRPCDDADWTGRMGRALRPAVTKDHGFVRIEARVETDAKTGVEMEALAAVTVAGLTIIDMVKAVDRFVSIQGVQMVLKSGGKTGLTRSEAWLEDPGRLWTEMGESPRT